MSSHWRVNDKEFWDIAGACKIHIKINGIVISTYLYCCKTSNNVRIYNSMSPCTKKLSNINLSGVGHLVVRSSGTVKLDIGIDQVQYCGYMYVVILQDEMLLGTEICFLQNFGENLHCWTGLIWICLGVFVPFNNMLRTHGHWAVRVLKRATSTVTRGIRLLW